MIKIYIVCHKPAYVPKNRLFFPVQVGTSHASSRYPGMLHDDSGENISAKNGTYCELTAQYWAWKNENADYYGFFHYRRYLTFTKIYPVDVSGRLRGKKRPVPYMEADRIPDDLTPYGLDEKSVSAKIEGYDIITVLRERINTTVYRQYAQYHDPETLNQTVKILKERYPEFAGAADVYLASRDIYYMNMFIMKKELFMQYCSWLFDILGTYEEQSGDEPETEARLMGYLAERLFGIFYTYQKERGAKCAEVPYIRFYDTRTRTGDEEIRIKEDGYREFRIGSMNWKVKVNMRRVNRLFPAGSRRRILLRSLILRKPRPGKSSGDMSRGK